MQERQTRNKAGRWLCAAAALCFSLGGVCVLRAKGLSPLALSGARCAAAAALTGLFCVWRGRRLRFNTSVATGALAVCLTGFCYVAATRISGAATAIILQYTSPAVAALWLWAAKKGRRARQSLRRWRWWARARCAAALPGRSWAVCGGLRRG